MSTLITCPPRTIPKKDLVFDELFKFQFSFGNNRLQEKTFFYTLSAGLIYGLYLGAAGLAMIAFLLVCIVVAGVYGAMTATKAAFVAQSIPATLALIALFLNI